MKKVYVKWYHEIQIEEKSSSSRAPRSAFQKARHTGQATQRRQE